MTGKRGASERFSLARWSRRKLETAATAPPAPPSVASRPPSAAVPVPPPELPPVESLSFESDFTAFLRPDVDDKIKRAALKQLFRDPRFNVMDGLDTYIDDYTKAEPLAPDVVAELLQRGFGRAEEAGLPPASAAGGAAEPATEPPEALPAAGRADASALPPARVATASDGGAGRAEAGAAREREAGKR